jgi:membrane fusion protein, multidrug efflux system
LPSYRRAIVRYRWLLLAVLIVIVAGGYFVAIREASHGPAASAGGAPVPVSIAEVKTADFPVWLDGLGTVTPYDTVTVKSRVDGQIIQVDFRQGQMVQEGDVLVRIDPRPYQAALDQVTAKQAQDEASLRDAQLNLARYAALATQDFASRQQLNTQQSTVQQAQAQIQGDQAAIDNAKTQLDYTTIRAPLTGLAGFRTVDPGNIVHAADTTGMVTIVKLQPISVVFTAPEEEIVEINKALAAGEVPVKALSSDGTKTLSEGHLAVVNNAVDQASGTISMKATFQNQDNALWPGLSVATRLLLDTLKGVIVVPETAVGHGPNGLYMFVVGTDNKVAMRSVTVGQQSSDQAVIAKGIQAGEKIVVSGQYDLQPGTLVTAAPEPAPPTAGGTATAAAH